MPRGVNPMCADPSSDTEGSDTLVHAEGLWFEDSGLIIQAENTLFRVSRDFLAARSSVFAEMLSLPMPQNAALMYGCPVVYLPDSAEDTTFFLKALIYSEFFEPYPARTTFPVLAGVLRMSHKYAVDVLRKRSLLHLSSAHAITLQEWELADAQFNSSWFDAADCDYIQMIHLARQTSALWILPTVFYRMCRYSRQLEEDIINGTDSGTLRSHDKVVYMRAARFLESTATSDVLEFLWSPPEINDCSSSKRCIRSRHRLRRIAEGWRRVKAGEDSICMPLDIWDEDDWKKLEICQRCLSAMRKTHQDAKQSVWNQLPEILELPDWADLECMRDEALN
ncbi:hypothetical protein C8R44DRAFT_888264 [Mycena epipterygia]|nr:hypothetical protein C8R44DRAFT_888264 [Mycena epipterygia]